MTTWRRFNQSRLWFRWKRWMSESRIRLPTPGLRPEDLRPGDRLEIESTLWRLDPRPEAEADAPSEIVFPLHSLDAVAKPPVRARLHITSGRWALLSHDGSAAMELDPTALIHYPVRGDAGVAPQEEAHVA